MKYRPMGTRKVTGHIEESAGGHGEIPDPDLWKSPVTSDLGAVFRRSAVEIAGFIPEAAFGLVGVRPVMELRDLERP